MSATGHEEEFRRIFRDDAEVQLSRIADHAIDLESGANPEIVAELFREAHTLKGASAVVGFDEVSRVAHVLEDLFESLRAGRRAPSRDVVEAVLMGVDALRDILGRLDRAEDCSAAADAAEIALRAAIAGEADAAAADQQQPEPDPAPTAAEAPDTDVADTPAIGASTTTVADVPAEAPAAARGGDDTVRVPVERLDELVRLVGESAAAQLRVGRLLEESLGIEAESIAEFRQLSRVLNDLHERTMRARMVTLETVTAPLRRAVRELAGTQEKQVAWEVTGGDTELDRRVLEQVRDPLMHLVRNAVDHGIEPPAERVAAGKPPEARLTLHASQRGAEVLITVSDDGRGIDPHRVRSAGVGPAVEELTDAGALELIFEPGFSTSSEVTDVSGRGVGLDAVRCSVDALRGRIEVDSQPGAGTTFRIVVPMTLALVPCLLVRAADERYAIPVHSVVTVIDLEEDTCLSVEGLPSVLVDDEPVTVSDLARELHGTSESATGPIVVMASATRRHAFRVDALVGRRPVVVKDLGNLLPRVDVLAGASVESDGRVVLVIDPPGLIAHGESLGRGSATSFVPILDAEDAPARKAAAPGASVLVVDDALTIRELQRTILERAGYEVRVAADGQEALARLAERPADLVLTDVEMPRLDGFGLTTAIREQPHLESIRIVILSSLGDEASRRRGLEAGADGYLVKSDFDEGSLLSVVERTIGVAA